MISGIVTVEYSVIYGIYKYICISMILILHDITNEEPRSELVDWDFLGPVTSGGLVSEVDFDTTDFPAWGGSQFST